MRILACMVAAAVAIGVAAPAHADANQDQAFLVSLGAAGLTYKDPQSAIAAGKTVCDMANQGKTGVEVVKVLQDANPSLSQMNAARFTAISAGVYCPAQLPPIQPSSGG
ncbi:MAG: DUF732 domain-containing protein [Mycobacterium sp.]|nr:DUF732 domain-containing protein [Mycobacterium sp.]